MHWLFGLGNQIFSFCASAFDVGSDIANAMNFLEYSRNQTYSNISSLPQTNLTHPIKTHSTMAWNPTNETMNCATVDQRDDFIWGYLSLAIVFLPGIVNSTVMRLLSLINGRKWCSMAFCIIFVIPLIGAISPVLFLMVQLGSILYTCKFKEPHQVMENAIATLVGFEAVAEATPQLILQLFTIFNGYPSGLLQKVTIMISFFTIARVSILGEIANRIRIEASTKETDGKLNGLSFVESLMETIYRLPLYVSTIMFRVGSLCLILSYLRYYSLIPLAFLLAVQAMITWTRCKKIEKYQEGTTGLHDESLENVRLAQTALLMFKNVAVVNAYGGFDLEEDEKDLMLFIKNSAIATFTHHWTLLITIMVVSHFSPNAMEHWDSECDFPVKPGMHAFFWIFGAVLFMGLCSLTLIMFQAPSMIQVKANKDTPHDQEKRIEIPNETNHQT